MVVGIAEQQIDLHQPFHVKTGYCVLIPDALRRRSL
jgi:hypothetical protein